LRPVALCHKSFIKSRSLGSSRSAQLSVNRTPHSHIPHQAPCPCPSPLSGTKHSAANVGGRGAEAAGGGCALQPEQARRRAGPAGGALLPAGGEESAERRHHGPRQR
jgi:hypothetical protein